MTFSVYFTATKTNDESKVISSVQVFEELTKFEPVIVETERADGATFLDDELEAFLLAMEVVVGEEFDDVVLYNQNKLLFDWLMKMSHESVLREAYYVKIKGLMQKAYIENGTTIKSGVVKGKDNEAKTSLKKYMKNRGQDLQDLTSMFAGMEMENKQEKKKKGTGRVINLNNRRLG